MKNLITLPLVGLSLTSLASTVTFTGENGGYFSDRANWKDGVLPVNGDYVVIENVAGSAATNDLEGLVLSGITFNGMGALGSSGEGDLNYFNFRGKKISFLPDSSFVNTKKVRFYQQLPFEIISGSLTISATNNGRFDNYALISGEGGLVCSSGRFYSYFSNTYTGETLYNGDSMGIFRNDSLGFGDVTVEKERNLVFYNDRGATTYLNNFHFKGTSGSTTVNLDFRGSTTIKGSVTLDSKNRMATSENQVWDVLNFETKVSKPNAAGEFILNPRIGDKIVFKDGVNAPGSTMWHDTVGEVHFDGGTSSFNRYRLSNGGVYFNAPFTVPEEAELRFVGDKACVFSFTGEQCVEKISSFEGKGQNSILTAQGEATLVVKAVSSENYNSKITGPLSFVWYPTGNYKFSALNECSFSGSLVVSNGTFEALNEISSLTNISSLVVSSGASLILGEEVKINNRLEKLDISQGSTISFSEAQEFVVDDLYVDGVAQLDNFTYTGGEGNGSTVIHIDCLPLNVSVFVKMKPGIGTEYVWNGSGGLNNAFEYNANWETGVAPLINAKTLPVFAGGTSSTLNQNTDLNGIKHTQDANFDFGGAAENIYLKLFWGGITLKGKGSSERNFTFNMPVVIGGEQIWNTATKKNVVFNAPVTDEEGESYDIVKDGKGTVYFNAPNTFKGDLHITNGVVVVGENGTLGDSENGEVVINYLSAKKDDSQRIQLKPGAKITRPIKISQDGDYWAHYYVGPVTSGSGSCEIASLITMANGAVYRLGNPSSSITTIFSGGASNGTFYVQSRGDTIVTNKPLNVFKFYLDSWANLYIYSPSNILSGTGGNASVIASPNSKVHIMTKDAIVSPGHRITMRNGGTLDLHGHDLTLESVCSAGVVGTNAIVRSDAPACITMNLEGALESYITFEGAVSLKKYGSKSYTNDSKTLGDKTLNTSTGRIEVVEGNFILGPNQRWIGEKVVLSGSTAKFITRAGAQLSRKTDLEINASGAKLELAADSVVTCAVFRVNGVKQPTGTWGASTSSAQYKNDTLFATVGSGTLVVLGDGKGLILTFR